MSSLNSTLFILKSSHNKLERKIDNNSKEFNQAFTDIDSNMKIMENKSVEIASDLSEIKSSQTLVEEDVQNKFDMLEQSLSDLEFDMEKMENKSSEIASQLSDFKFSQTLFEDEEQDKYDMFNQSLSDLEFEIMEKIESFRDEIALNSSQSQFVEDDNNEMFNQTQSAP